MKATRVPVALTLPLLAGLALLAGCVPYRRTLVLVPTSIAVETRPVLAGTEASGSYILSDGAAGLCAGECPPPIVIQPISLTCEGLPGDVACRFLDGENEFRRRRFAFTVPASTLAGRRDGRLVARYADGSRLEAPFAFEVATPASPAGRGP